MLSVQPDRVLCSLAARGNEDAFATLHARYRQNIFAFVYHLLGRGANVDDAEDLTQEIFQKAYANLGARHDDGSFKAWLFRIARNHTFDHIRGMRQRTLSLDDATERDEPATVVSFQSVVDRRAELAWLVTAMNSLPERQREALVMRELGGLSVDEIADTLETTPESARQLIKRGRATVTTAADANGIRGKQLKRKLAAAAPITAITWVGAGKASAAAATGAAASAGAGAAAGGAVAGGTAAGGVAATAGGAGVVAVAGKVAATVLVVAAVGTGGVVAGEEIVGKSGEPAAEKTASVNSSSAGKSAESAAAEGLAGNPEALKARARARAAEKRAKAKAKAKRKAAKAKRRAAAKKKAAAERRAAAKGNGRGNSSSKSQSASTGSNGGSSSGSNSSGRSESAGQNSSGGDQSGGSGGNSSGGGNGSGGDNASGGGAANGRGNSGK